MYISQMQFNEMHISSVILLVIVLTNNPAASSNILLKTVQHLSSVLPDVSIPPVRPPNTQGHCLRLQCKYICFNGKSANIQADVHAVENYECESMEELHLYNYDFPKKTIPSQFLGNISDYVEHLFIYVSPVTTIEDGAFESRTLVGLHLENLNLINIHKGIFQNVSEKFRTFVLIQRENPIEHVDNSFLDSIKYQIKKLSIQTGLLTVKNLTNSECLLNSLEDVNLSNNNFEGRLTASSFRQLSVVEKLNLTHSEISFLPESIFSDIAATLKYLDLSSNKLTVISQNVFGWRDMRKGLIIDLSNNPWVCTCELRTDMVKILVYQTESVYCAVPEGIAVTDVTLCMGNELNNDTSSEWGGGASVPNPPFAPTESHDTTPTDPGFDADATTDANGIVSLECQKEKGSLETDPFSVQWPVVQFDIVHREHFQVDIVVKARMNGTYGILWFSKVTTQYYKMEVNYLEYGLGCYGIAEYVTTVQNLIPDTSYTFCLVLKDQLTVSPFSCKSTHISGNLDVKYNAWLTTNMKATGITLVVLGIVIFQFIGILFVFLLIKQKPTLVKGSKRVTSPRNDPTNIIVFPEDKTLAKFKLMEAQIAKRSSKGSNFRRLSSVSAASLESNQSYMNPVSPNLYEVIPAYQRYLATYTTETDQDVSYAEIPFKRKRSSNDPLPAVPTTSKPSTPALAMRKLEISREYIYDVEGSTV